MPRPLNNIREICRPFQEEKVLTLPKEVDDCIFFEEFIVCIALQEAHLELIVCDRITAREISKLQIEHVSSYNFLVRLDRLHKQSVGFCTYQCEASPVGGGQEQVITEKLYNCYVHPFHIDSDGIARKAASQLLLSTTRKPWTVQILTSKDDQNCEVVVLSVLEEGCQRIYDISETTELLLDSTSPTLTLFDEVMDFLVGRTLLVQSKEGNTILIKLYDLSTGALLRTQPIQYYGGACFYRNRFMIQFNVNEGEIKYIDIFNGEEVLHKVPSLIFWYPNDVTDDGCMMFVTVRKFNQVRTIRVNVPSLADIAKECLHMRELRMMRAARKEAK